MSRSARSTPDKPFPVSRSLRLVWVLLAVLALSGVLRVVGVSKEPFWLDEVLTYDSSTGRVSAVLRAAARDVHPPLYYLGLNAWRAAFGSSEPVLRGFSALWGLVGIAVVMALAWSLFRDRWAVAASGILAALNPTDIHFAQEARMYVMAATLGSLCALALWQWLVADTRRQDVLWGLAYLASAVLLLYTHYLGALLLIAQGLVALPAFLLHKRWRSVLGYLACGLVAALALAPWLLYAIRVRGGVSLSRNLSWIPRPTLDGMLGFLVDDFFWGWSGMSGTTVARVVSAALLGSLIVLATVALTRRPDEPRRDTLALLFALWLLVAPVVLASALSWLWRPIYYRPRFCMLVLPPFLLLCGFLCTRPKRAWAKVALVTPVALVMAWGSSAQYAAVTNTGLQHFVGLWHAQGPPDRAAFFPGYLRPFASYYLGEPIPQLTKARLDELQRAASIQRLWICTRAGWAPEPSRPDRPLYDRLSALGEKRQLATVDGVDIFEVTVLPIPLEYPRYGLGTTLDLADESSERYLWTGWYPAGSGLRWSRGRRAVLVFHLDEPVATMITASMVCFHKQRVTVSLNGHEIASFACRQRSPHTRQLNVPQGVAKLDNELVLDLPDAVSPAKLGQSQDQRQLALGLYWLVIE
jgi:4-amino-4-deoxy-L-arabinose transferase-like glycosyltransferase